MAPITSIHLRTKVAFGGPAANLRSLFRERKFLKFLTRLTVGEALPEIPLSVDSKLELLLRAFLCQMSVYFSLFCPCM